MNKEKKREEMKNEDDDLFRPRAVSKITLVWLYLTSKFTWYLIMWWQLLLFRLLTSSLMSERNLSSLRPATFSHSFGASLPPMYFRSSTMKTWFTANKKLTRRQPWKNWNIWMKSPKRKRWWKSWRTRAQFSKKTRSRKGIFICSFSEPIVNCRSRTPCRVLSKCLTTYL